MIELPEPVEFMGVKIHPLTQAQLVDTLTAWAKDAQKRRAYYVNAHAMNLAFENDRFRESLNGADLVYCDGYGVKVGAKLLGLNLPERMTPPDWIDSYLTRLSPNQPIFLLGDEPVVVERCARLMQERHPHLAVAGCHHGFFEDKGDKNEEVIQGINESGARVVLVGMSMPRQELWLDSSLVLLDVSLVATVGGLFRWYSGVEARAPSWLTDQGLEWLARLARHPLRLFGRYVVGLPLFGVRVLRSRLAPTVREP